MSHQTVIRVTRELAGLQRGDDLSLVVAFQDSNVRIVKAIIVGPPNTPYEYGFFEFLVQFPNQYPSKPPKVEARTTNAGRCRFNPNIYACGKVCLSILGTWRGETSGEEWSAVQTLESILLSIQSLMSSNPYENEPGFETANSREDQKAATAYIAKIRHETIRIAVLQQVEVALGIQPQTTGPTPPEPEVPAAEDPDEANEDYSDAYSDDDNDEDNGEDLVEGNAVVDPASATPGNNAVNSADDGAEADGSTKDERDAFVSEFEPFGDFYKQRFLWYYDTYCTTIDKYAKEHKDHAKFATMPFEGLGNRMSGAFQYSELKKRLLRVKKVLDEETKQWATDGLLAAKRELGTAVRLHGQFKQLTEHHKEQQMWNVSMELENQNPFVWIVTYFGKPMTNLDGGTFKIRISLSTNFPTAQPRVRFETPIYHHRVSKEGVLCYFPSKKDDMQDHLESIVQALEEVSPPLDPRTIVHPEATKLLWGTDDDKKKYHRLVRRSAEASTEEGR